MKRMMLETWWRWFVCFSFGLVSCDGLGGFQTDAVTACSASRFRYPTTREDFTRLYNGRGFYSDGNHLGRDLLLAEGTPIHPIACGAVRVYRSAQGYGTLVVVIEHRFPESRSIRNGDGEVVSVTGFLSIYGHLRASPDREGRQEFAFRSGDMVGPDDVIGYVEQDNFNGDGKEHLHLGLRLQTMAEASRADEAWFRGYDTNPSQKRWFADPETFLTQSMRMGTDVRWHPPGTVLEYGSTRWFVGSDGMLHSVNEAAFAQDRLASVTVLTGDEEMGCYLLGLPYVPWRGAYKLLKFSNGPTVYEYADSPPSRHAFISKEAFDSWGWKEAEIEEVTGDMLADFHQLYPDKGMRLIREGTLVKGSGGSEISLVSQGRRLPIFDWQTYLAMGYEDRAVYLIDASVIDRVAYPRGPVITTNTVDHCHRIGECEPGECRDGGANPVYFRDMFVPKDFSMVRDMSPVKSPELCNGKDDDGNGQIDEAFPCPLGKKGGFCLTRCGSPGYLVCEAPGCTWGACQTYPEDCGSTIDEDCDGLVDCADTDCLKHARCAVPADMSAPVINGYRYEVRVADHAGWQAIEPYQLRDQWWVPIRCQNTGSDQMERRQDGWYRCDVLAPVSPFVGSFFSQAHPNWGDQGKLGTVGNSPAACTPTEGIEWNIIRLDTGKGLFLGPASNLPCVTVAGQSRHVLP